MITSCTVAEAWHWCEVLAEDALNGDRIATKLLPLEAQS